MRVRHLTPLEYPSRFSDLKPSPEALSVSGDIEAGNAKVVAIVGARKATAEAAQFAADLARACAKAGGIVASGGALGIDAAAHAGALDVGGRTWAVLGTSSDRIFPPENKALFDRIAEHPSSSLIWPFAQTPERRSGQFRKRNGFLVGLADVVVVVQAAPQSGSLNTANKTRTAGKPLWFVSMAPWTSDADAEAFAGNREQIDRGGVRVLTSKERFLFEVFGPVVKEKSKGLEPDPNRSPEENALLSAATNRPKHLDDLCEIAGLAPQAAATPLLTLALEHVLVEGPPGYYRRGLGE